MTKEKLERAHEISVRIDHIRVQLDFLEELPIRLLTDERTAECFLNGKRSFVSFAGEEVVLPKELLQPTKDMLESYFRKELEKAEKEFEEM